MGGYIGATGLDEVQEQFDILKDEIDANASYINTLVGIPDPTHLPFFGVNILNPGLYGLVERAEVNIKALQTQQGTSSTAISGIETSITGIEASITGIGGQITAVEGSISTIQFVELPLLSASIVTAGGVAADALVKANRSLDIWEESGNNVYHKKSGNVGIGITYDGLLNNKLEVNGNINIPTGSTFRINNEPFNYSHLAGTQPISSKWTNATDTSTNIFFNTGNVGIGKTTAIINRLEVGGNLNISTGSKYKIGDVNLAFSDLGGTLSYNSLTDKPTLFDGNYNSLTNKLTQGTNITITGNVINNTYSLPTAGVGTGGTLGGVKVDGTTIQITNQVISAVAGAQQVNSDWTQTNTSLKSFIQNKPTAGANISFANNQISLTDFVGIGTTPPSGNTKLDVNGNINSTGLRINNLAIGSDPTQNIINLSGNKLLINDKPDTERYVETFTTHTSLSEPSITSPTFNSSIRAFVHSGGTEDQTSYNITIGQNTICDILIVGGGGGGTAGHGAGGGAGQLVFINNAILNGTYTIKVGKGGNGSTLSGTSSTMGTLTNGTKGGDSHFGSVIAEGGGISVNDTLKNGGSGAGGDGHLADGGVGGKGLKNATIDTFSSGVVYSKGNDGGDGGPPSGQGGGGGGAGSAGTTGGLNNDSQRGNGGNGLSGIPEISYDFKTNFGNYGKLETDGNYWFAGGGAGGVYYINSSVISNGGKGGGGSTPSSVYLAKINGESGVNGTGGGGAGGSAWYGNGGNGGSGIVIIKFKSIVSAGIPEGNPITHKTLNFKYIKPTDNLIFYYRIDESPYSWLEAYNEAIAKGRRIPTYLELKTYMTDYAYVLAPFNGTDTWSPCINPASTAPNNRDWIQIGNLAHARGKSHFSEVNGYPSWGDNATYDYARVYWDVVDLNQANTYTLPVSEGTSISINSGTFQYLSGNYTISVGATQSSVVIAGISQIGQTDPYPLQNGSTIAIRYSMLRRTISFDYYKKSGFIKYVPSLVGGEFPDTGSWAIVNIDSQALAEFAGSISFDRVIGNLPLDKLQNIDMSKITTGNLPFSRIDGNLAASRLDLSSGITLPADITAITSGGNGRVYYINNGASIYSGYGTGDIIQFRNADNTTLLSVNSDTSVRSAAFIAQGLIARGGGYDIRTFSGSTGMYIEMGNENTFIPHYFRLGSYGGVSFIESGYSKNIVFRVYSSYIPTGTYKQWAFNEGGASYNGFNSSTWTVPSDHRIKENIVKADLKTCYDNVKNINLYRYNFIDAFETGSNDKNKLGYIAQEVEKYFPKATYRQKKRLNDKREVPDLLSIDVEQINLSLYGAVKQLIKIVEKQNKRIKTLETLLNIEVSDDIENDAGEAYEKIIDEEEINIEDIEPTEPSTEV